MTLKDPVPCARRAFASALCALFAALSLASCLSAGAWKDDRPLVDPGLFEPIPSDPAAPIQLYLQDLPMAQGTALRIEEWPEASFRSADGSAFSLLSFRVAILEAPIAADGREIARVEQYYRLKSEHLARGDERAKDGRFEFFSFVDSLKDEELEVRRTGNVEPPDPSTFATLRSVTAFRFVFRSSAGVVVPIQILVERTDRAEDLEVR